MKLVEYISGNAIKIVYLDCGRKKFDLEPFLRELERTRHQEATQLRVHLDKVASFGVFFNNYKEKRLKGNHAQPLCEFCSRKECRIFWFFDGGNLIVCTHGFVARGNHNHAAEIERGQLRRKMYNEWKQSNAGGSGSKKLGPPEEA